MEASIFASIIIALTTGGLSLIGVIITNSSNNKSIENKIMMTQAITDTKLENLTLEVRRHNEFAVKIPTMEAEIKQIKEDVSDLKHTDTNKK